MSLGNCSKCNCIFENITGINPCDIYECDKEYCNLCRNEEMNFCVVCNYEICSECWKNRKHNDDKSIVEGHKHKVSPYIYSNLHSGSDSDFD